MLAAPWWGRVQSEVVPPALVCMLDLRIGGETVRATAVAETKKRESEVHPVALPRFRGFQPLPS